MATQLHVVDLCYCLDVLQKVQQPSPRTSGAINKLQDLLCGLVEGIEEQLSVPKHVFDAVSAVKDQLDKMNNPT